MSKINILCMLTIIAFPFLSEGQNFDAIFKKYNVEGSIVMLDLKNDQWTFSNKADAYTGSLPASTFKIVNSCVALQAGVVKDENEIIPWDKKVRTFNGNPVAAWNKDTDMKNAFKNSTVWFYVELAKRIGRSKYRKILNKINYGNNDFSEKGIDFWNYGNFKVTPVQQILFLKNLYFNKLPFDKQVMETVKTIMLSDSTDEYIVRGKTGWTDHKGKNIGWYVGYISVKDNVYFFANRLTQRVSAKNGKFNTARKDIVSDVFREMKIIK